MKIRRTLFRFIVLTAMVVIDLTLITYCKNIASLNQLLVQDTLEKIRALEVSTELLEDFKQWEKEESGFSCYDYLCIYLMTNETAKNRMDWYLDTLSASHNEKLQLYTTYLEAVWEDLQYFPIPYSVTNQDAGISFGDSWMALRTFGGKRGHEGTDIMASINERGIYPVISMTDGIVEQIGWLTQGGYRLGIRSPHGGYFYYAHLHDYAKEFQPGDSVKAGELLGFMGDSGYSEIEGTVGNFDVHLHMGIYVNQPDGTEISINSFWPLKYLEEKRLRYKF